MRRADETGARAFSGGFRRQREALGSRPSARGTRRTHLGRVEVPRRGARLEGNICALRQVVEPRVADIAPTERVRLAVLPKERPGAMVALQPCDGARHLSYIMTEPGQDCAQPPNHTGFRESPG